MKDIEKDIKNAYKCIEMDDIKQSILNDIEYVHQLDAPVVKKKSSLYLKLGYVCLSFLVVFGFIFNSQSSYQYIVSLDVNPSIDLQLDNDERVIEVVCHNDEGKQVLDDMDLKDVDVDVAVNAIIGSMFKQGYIDEIKNSVLVTVQSENEETRAEIKERIAEDIKQSLKAYSIEGSVISQELDIHPEVENVAKEYGISVGKAYLIQELINENSDYQFEDLTGLSINDLSTLVHFNNIHFKTITVNGIENHSGYLNNEDVKRIVIDHSQVNENDIKDYKCELESKDSRLIYSVEFKDSFGVYYYKVNAVSGEILSFKVELY